MATEDFIKRLTAADEMIAGHALHIELLENNYYDDRKAISDKLVGIFTHDSHIVGIIDADKRLCICTDVRYNTRLEILFQDIMEILYNIERYACSMQDYR